MLQNYNKYTLLKVFLQNTTESFRLRELSRIIGLAPMSVMRYLKEFEQEKLVKKYEKRGVPFYQAERENERFKLYQKISIVYELNESGFVQYLWEEIAPEAIILFGSHAKGEAVEQSDIDIRVIGKERKIVCEGYEKKLGKKIHIIFYQDISEIRKEMKNNLANGIILRGYFEVLPSFFR